MYESKYIYILYVYEIYHDSTWKRLRQPCANLAPSLCFAGFPCVTPHNENVKSYKSVGCVPPRLKFLFRTFDRLPYTSRPIFIRHGQVLDLGSPSCFSTEKLEVKHCPNMVVLWGKKTLM